ncbi:MAG: hypothetical protein P8163_19240 [Candidatus Thiodiazotropha sp.]
MAKNHCTGNPCPVKKLKQQSLADGQACPLLAKAIDTTELAQTGFNELGALCQAIRHTSDKHTNPYHLAGIGLYDQGQQTIPLITTAFKKQKPRSVMSEA